MMVSKSIKVHLVCHIHSIILKSIHNNIFIFREQQKNKKIKGLDGKVELAQLSCFPFSLSHNEQRMEYVLDHKTIDITIVFVVLVLVMNDSDIVYLFTYIFST